MLEPNNKQTVTPNKTNKLILTTLNKRTSPAIHYHTNNRVHVLTEPCTYKRETLLIKSNTITQLNDMLKVKNVNL